MRRTSGSENDTWRNIAMIVGALVLVGFAIGFAGGYFGGSGGGPETGPPKTMQQLAVATGCTPKSFQTKSFQQGTCQTSRGNFVIVTFPNDEELGKWLKVAKDSGNSAAYLVGTRWVIMGDKKIVPLLEEFHDELGGQVQRG